MSKPDALEAWDGKENPSFAWKPNSGVESQNLHSITGGK